MVNAALVLASGFNALSIVEDLGQAGIEVFSLDDMRGIAAFSKYSKYVHLPNPNIEFELAKNVIINFVNDKRDYERIFIIPTSDGHCLLLSKIKEELASNVICCIGSWETTQSLIDKKVFGRLAATYGWPVPKEILIDKLSALSEDQFPVVLKPIEKQYEPEFSKLSENSSRIIVLKNTDQIEKILLRLNSIKEKVICQEYITGFSDQMYTVGVYVNNKKDHAHFFYGKKVRGYPAEHGDCIFGESIDEIPVLRVTTEKIIKELNLFGIFEFEYKYDNVRQRFFLIEINPRSWSWIGITKYFGGSLALKFVEDHSNLNLANQKISGFKKVAYVKIFQDIFNTFFRYKKVRPEWNRSPYSWWLEIKSYDKVVYAEFRVYDFRILLGIAYLVFFRLTRMLKRN